MCFIMFHLFLSENLFTKWFKKSKKSASISSSEDETAVSISASSPAIPAPPASHWWCEVSRSWEWIEQAYSGCCRGCLSHYCYLLLSKIKGGNCSYQDSDAFKGYLVWILLIYMPSICIYHFWFSNIILTLWFYLKIENEIVHVYELEIQCL